MEGVSTKHETNRPIILIENLDVSEGSRLRTADLIDLLP
jgi:hypothetical protein